MNILKKLSDFKQINLFVAGFFMCIATVLMVHDALLFKFDIHTLVIINVLVWVVLTKFFENEFINNIKKIKTKTIVIISFILVYSLYISGLDLKDVLIRIWSFLTSSFLYIIGLSEKLGNVEEFILMAILLITTNLIYNSLIRNLANVKIFLFIIIYFLLQWNRYINSATTYLSIYIFGVILYVIFKNNYMFNFKNNTGRSNIYSQFILAVFLAVYVISLSHGTTKIMDLDYLNERIGNLVPDISYLRDDYNYRAHNRVFDLNSTIYQPNPAKLGGSITLDKSIKLIVETPYPDIKLRGSVKNIYTGDLWIKSDEEVTDFEPVNPELSLFEVKVNPVGLETSTLLTPLNTMDIKIDSGKIKQDNEGIISYKNYFLGKKLKEYSALVLRSPTYTNLSDTEKETYLKLPENYSKEVINLTLSIIKNKKTDKEKAEAIEFFLRNEYTYTLKVKDYGDSDFVKNFLIDDKKGYCTYFASSMVIMSRIAGIPARYVEGFILPEKENDKGTYEVTGDLGHAWPELYIKGIGWSSFEPTPVYGQELYLQEVDKESVVEDSPLENNLFDKQLKDDEVRVAGQRKAKGKLLIGILLTAFLIITILIILFLNKKKKDEKRILKFTEKEIAISKIYDIFRKGKTYSEDISKEKLPKEIMKMILDKINYIEVDESVIINAMNIILFSEKEIDENLATIMDSLDKALEKHIKENLNIIGYTIFKYKISS